MRITKNRKLISIILSAVMLIVFAITVGMLCVLQKNNNKQPATSLVADPVADYTINAPVRNSDTVKWVSMGNVENSWTNILYPTQIYLDKGKGETLDSAGYYFFVSSCYSSGENRRIRYLKNTFGYSDGSYNGVPVSQAWANEDWYAFMRLFDYNLEFVSVNNTWGEVDGSNSTNGLRDTSVFGIGAKSGSEFEWKYMMKGGIKSTTQIGQYKYRSVPNNNPKVTSHYLTYRYLGNDSKTVSNSEAVGFEYNRTDWREMDGVNTSFTNGMDIDIYIYDKSELGQSVADFKTRIANDKTILNKINGGDSAYQHAESFINNIETNVLKKREVTTAQINAAVAEINAYQYQINAPSVSTGKVYDATDFDISSAFKGYDSKYFDVELLDGSGSPATLVNVGEYKIKITLKNTIDNKRFVWADGSGNAPKEYTYKITPNTFTASVADQTYKYKVSNYDVGIVVNSYENHKGGQDINPITTVLSLELGNFADGLETISKSEVGNYTIYYKMTSPNHNDTYGSFTLQIEKADIVLRIKKLNCTYGENYVPTADEIYNSMFDWDAMDIFDATDTQQKRDYIIGNAEKNIEGVLTQVAIAKDGIAIDGSTYPDVGNYNLLITRNSAFDSKANVTFARDGETTMDVGAYIVNPRSISVSWTQQENMWYDNKAGKRPTATIIDEGVSANVSVVIVGDGIGFDGKPVALVGDAKEAIYAGTYTAKAICDNNNYKIEESVSQQEFTILQRLINVTVKDRGRSYAQSKTAQGVWNDYLDLFKANINNDIYELTLHDSINDGSGALANNDLAYDVFEILLKDAMYTNGTESERYFKVGAYALEPSLLTTGDKARNYKFSSAVSGTFTVRNADINFTLLDLPALVFKGVAQNVVVDKNDTRIAFKGWENEHREEVKLYFAESQEEAATSVREEFIKVTNANTYTIWCRITAPNHNDLVKELSIKVEKSNIYIDVTGQTREFIYGNGVPSSAVLKEMLGINWYWSTNPVENEKLKIEDMDRRIVFHVLDGNGGSHYNEGAKIIVGNYTVHHALAEGELIDNYMFTYVTNDEGVTKDIGAFAVSPKELNVDWTQDANGWSFDQNEQKWKFIYNNTPPSISVKALAADIAWNDEIKLSTSVSGKDVGNYTATTNLTVDINKANYVLKGNTFNFDIVPLNVYIKVNTVSREFGKVQQNRPLGKDMPLLAPGSEGAVWNYDDAHASRFFSDDYINYCFISDAITADGNCKDVGTYDITITTIEGANGEITKNYNVIITNTNEAKFIINPADIIYNGIRFNINKDSDDSYKIITKEQIRQLISIDEFKGVNRNEFNIMITDLKEDKTPSDAWISGDQISAALKDVGVYYLSLRIEHKNFNTLNFEVEVNVYDNWVSVIINEKITVTYGDVMPDSKALYEMLRGKINIIGFDVASDDEALDMLSTMIEIYVGSNNNRLTFNGPVASYSIFFDQETNNTTGENTRKFRFLAKNGETIDSNIDAYVIIAKELEMDWADDMNIDEVYGEHDENNSPSHTCTQKLILVAGEPNSNIRVTTRYEKFENGSWVGVSGHAKDVGKYRVIITGVNSENYFIVENKFVKEFNITPKTVEISLKNRDSVTYGNESTTRDGMISYLNNIPNGFVPYDLVSGAFIDDVTTIFSYKLKETLVDSQNYYSVGDYTIDINVISNNYIVNVNKFGTLTVEKATIVYNRAQFVPQVFTGNDLRIAANNKYYSLSGDIKEATSIQYKIKGSSDDFTSDLFVTNVGTYEILIKITAENHNDYITNESNAVTFEVKPVYVEISMQQTDKVYGDTINDLITSEGVNSFSEWLIKKCNITFYTYTLDNGGNRVAVEVNMDRLKEDFKFKVIQNDQGGSEAIIVGKNNVGTYTVSHENAGEYAEKMKNYNVDYYKSEGMAHRCNYDAYKIVRRKVSVQWETENSTEQDGTIYFEYNSITGPGITAKVQEVGKDGFTILPVVFRPENVKRIKSNALNVGRYYAEVIDGDGFDLNSFQKNYELLDRTFNFAIAPRKITVTINIPSCVYGSEQSLIGHTIDLNGKISVVGEDLNTIAPYISLSIVNPDNLTGKYYAVANYTTKGLCSSENYDVTFITDDFVVTNAQMDITISNYDLKYSGNKNGYTVDVKSSLGLENGYTIKGDMAWDSVQILYDQGNGTYTETMPVILGVTSGKAINCKAVLANHEDKFFTITYNIAPANIKINWADSVASSVYGDDLLSSAVIFAKTGATVDSSSDIQINLEDLIAFVVSDTELNTTGKVNVGKYKIGYTFIDNNDKDCYNIRFNKESYYSVIPKEITFNWNYTSLIYNGKKQTISAEVVEILAGDTINIEYSGNAYVNAGNYIATIESIDNSNYTIANKVEFNWSISPKSVGVDWNGSAFTYTGKAQHPTASINASDLCGNDTCVIRVTGEQENAGSYTATATSLNSNYKVTDNATFDFVINPKAITFSWNDDVLVYNGNAQVPSAVASGLIDGESVELIVEGAQINAGNGYIAKVTGVNNANYVVAKTAMENTKAFNIEKGKNEFVAMADLPETLDQLPWTNGNNPLSKYGNVVVKYFSDKECTKEVKNIEKVGNGRYWVVVSVAGTDNYDAISKTFEVQIKGNINLAAVIAGSVTGGLVLIAAIVATVILVTKKKKRGLNN